MSAKGQSETPLPLSARAHQAAVAESESLIFDVLRNLRGPYFNLDGFFNVGVAENVITHDFLLEYMNKSAALLPKYLTYNDWGGGSMIAHVLKGHVASLRPIELGHLFVTNGGNAGFFVWLQRMEYIEMVHYTIRRKKPTSGIRPPF
ncbi:hypothetical protein ASPVEDRAFT_78125 [Aspergillus versicolor CBS 583.65]|uniref:Uncharacterized protein n=1 Tax=Aspergillus versicolor CBS 583.65 TaxID=1036611 RepID=A0A1L9P4A4_ASPVE|nr:uncharacterized protein ASPVEDRAFT_78125 [Aspergillus versicolor CBS 583.65]OJI96351.1 hypothetical protein ASPVEDRAFT_78125 [Aspergillus versicolor CBS 583.65]